MANTSSSNSSDKVNVGAQPVATVYAKALVGSAESGGRTDEVLDELDSLVSDVLDAYPRFEEVLNSGLINADDKVAILDRSLGKSASPLVLSFLKVLAEHGRLDTLREVLRLARRRIDELRGRKRVEIVTATPLEDSLAGRISEQLRVMLGGEPHLVRSVDADVIGGIVLRIGDTVYDGSVSTRLERARRQMINRSLHEIQSRRDSFSHSAGN